MKIKKFFKILSIDCISVIMLFVLLETAVRFVYQQIKNSETDYFLSPNKVYYKIHGFRSNSSGESYGVANKVNANRFWCYGTLKSSDRIKSKLLFLGDPNTIFKSFLENTKS